MDLILTSEALLVQLGYTNTIHTLRQMKTIIENTKNFEKFSKHILSLNDALAVENAFISMSSSKKYLKIKCRTEENLDKLLIFFNMVEQWAEKYKVELKKIENKNIYYILGCK